MNFRSAPVPFLLAVFLATNFAYAATLEELRDQGAFRLGFANETPYVYITPGGDVVGADLEIITEVFQRLGVNKAETTSTTFGSLIPGLKARLFDVVATGMYIRPDRCREVLFSEPNFVVQDAVLVRKNNPENIHDYGVFVSNTDLRFGHLAGGNAQNAKNAGVPEDRILTFSDNPTAIAALRAGRIDGFLRTSIDALEMVKVNAEHVEVADPFDASSGSGKAAIHHAGFAFHRDDVELHASFNEEFRNFFGSPAHLAILEKYNILPSSIEIAATTDQLCGS